MFDQTAWAHEMMAKDKDIYRIRPIAPSVSLVFSKIVDPYPDYSFICLEIAEREQLEKELDRGDWYYMSYGLELYAEDIEIDWAQTGMIASNSPDDFITEIEQQLIDDIGDYKVAIGKYRAQLFAEFNRLAEYTGPMSFNQICSNTLTD